MMKVMEEIDVIYKEHKRKHRSRKRGEAGEIVGIKVLDHVVVG